MNELTTTRYDDPKMLDTIRNTVAKGATEPQFRMFIEICRATGLNPFLKEIWFVPGVGVMAGRDGYLRVANEHPQFDGIETRVERDEKGIPVKAVCSVWRKDRNHPTVCEAYFNEYRKSSSVWNQYPSAMIGKVAEVLALKRSFSINGVVTEEEIGEQEPRGTRQAAQDVAQAKIAALQAGKPYGEISEVHDAVEVDTPAEKQEKPKKTGKFAMLENFKSIKKELNVTTGNDDIYYAVLGAHGYEKSSQIPTLEAGRTIYRGMQEKLEDIQKVPENVEG
jgi:phage recombination protein Bet